MFHYFELFSYGNCNYELYLIIYYSQLKDYISRILCICVCVCVCVCVCTLPPWRLLPSARYLIHTWGVLINDVMLRVSFQVLLPSSFVSTFRNVILHFQRRDSNSRLFRYRYRRALIAKKYVVLKTLYFVA